MLIHDRFDVLILTKVRFLFQGYNAMIQGRKASLGFITHNFSNEKGERVNVLKKVEAHYTQKISYSYFLPS